MTYILFSYYRVGCSLLIFTNSSNLGCIIIILKLSLKALTFKLIFLLNCLKNNICGLTKNKSVTN